MKGAIKKSLIAFSIFILSFNLILAQTLTEALEKMLKENATGYIQPLVTGFGTATNCGLYKKASVSTGVLPIPIGFDIGIVGAVSFVPDKDKEFEFSLLENTIEFPLSEVNSQLPNINLKFDDLYNSEKKTTPTIASKEEGTTLTPKEYNEIINSIISELGDQGVENPEEYKSEIKSYFNEERISTLVKEFSFPDGYNVFLVPSAALQINLRLPIGVEVSFRGLPEVEIHKEIGKLSSYGIGLRKSLPVPIVDVTIGAFYQLLNVADVLTATNLNYHAEIGKRLPIPLIEIHPYIGAGVDNTKIELDYTIKAGTVPGIDEPKHMKFDLKGENRVRKVVGLTLQLIPFTYINIEGAAGKYQALTVSFGAIFK